MSGGSFNYGYSFVDDKYAGKMKDRELNELIKDLVEVLHDLEWSVDCDISHEEYLDTVVKFKKKWFGNRKVRLQGFVTDACAELRTELLQMIGDRE